MHSRGVEERIPLGLCSNLIPLTFELPQVEGEGPLGSGLEQATRGNILTEVMS